MPFSGAFPIGGAVPFISSPRCSAVALGRRGSQLMDKAQAEEALHPTTPRVILTPWWGVDPPVWDMDGSVIPPALDQLLLPMPEADQASCVMAVVVPFYSEAGHTLRRSVEALALQRQDMRRVAYCEMATGKRAPGRLPDIHVVAIADGWRKPSGETILSDSMLDEIMGLYPQFDVQGLLELLEGDGNTGAKGEPLPDHVFVQFGASTDSGSMRLSPLRLDCTWVKTMNCRNDSIPDGLVATLAAENEGAIVGGVASGYLNPHLRALAQDVEQLYFTLLIKRNNGRKHHSHRWFFEALGPVTRIRSGPRFEYYFATDAGTLYSPFCIAELSRHMDAHPLCAASTAHQRIMHSEDQADPNEDAPESFLEQGLRNVQAYDFESGLCVFNGLHAMCKFLPVVPG
jgi:hypothetical protein